MNKVERREELKGLFMDFLDKNPNFGKKIKDMTGEVYRDGALDSKTKRLMALAVAVVDNCEGCTLAQTIYALEQGATVDEIMETCEVAMSIGGTPGGRWHDPGRATAQGYG